MMLLAARSGDIGVRVQRTFSVQGEHQVSRCFIQDRSPLAAGPESRNVQGSSASSEGRGERAFSAHRAFGAHLEHPQHLRSTLRDVMATRCGAERCSVPLVRKEHIRAGIKKVQGRSASCEGRGERAFGAQGEHRHLEDHTVSIDGHSPWGLTLEMFETALPAASVPYAAIPGGLCSCT
ncbi:hypothetical protein AcW1_001713 [Taiwanofungus camphoratus]|nr:hypothetical protein AcW1_001713 [Antrodia cinnamomea]